MKKFIFILLILVMITTTGCAKKEDSKYLKEVTYKEFLNKIENEDTFILEIMATSCSHCQTFTPKLVSVLEEYEITAYKINLSNISEEDEKALKKEYSYGGTPEVIFFFEGKEKSKLHRISGDVTRSKIVAKFKSTNFIEN